MFKFILEYTKLQSYQGMLHYHHLQVKLSNEFLLIRTHQDLLPYLIALSFILGKLFSELTSLNLDLFLYFCISKFVKG